MSATTEVSLKVVRVGLFGFGGVGQAVARVATSASGRLGDAGVLIKCVGALVRDGQKPRVAPLIPVWTDADEFPFHDCDVIVEVLGGVEPARTLVDRALRLGVPVVTANKSLVAAHGIALQATAWRMLGERALGSLAQGHIVEAARHNALVVLAIPLMLIWLYDGYRGGNWFTGRVWLGLAALMLVFAVLRNLPGVGWLGP